MPVITIKTAGWDRSIEFSPGRTLREILDSTAFRVRSGCRGTGACGLCRVKIKADELAEPNQVERIHLSEEQIAAGERLACQVIPLSRLEVSLLGREPVPSWRALPPHSYASQSFSCNLEAGASPARKLPKCQGEPYGVAVDLGTTHISVTFHNFTTGQWFAGRRGLNPQGTYGSDVMTRLIAADESQEAAQDLRKLAVDAIGSAIMDIATCEGIGSDQVARVVIVGNTAMLALMSGRNSHQLLKPAYWTSLIDCIPEYPTELRSDWAIHPEALIEVLQPLAGFVGSDLLAGVFAARLTEKAPGTLLVDFGTNSELALWDGQSLWVTSAAGGPAFEGCGINCGTSGGPGAIYRVKLSSENAASAKLRADPGASNSKPAGSILHHGASPDFEFLTIDDAPPKGLCGSGIVDLVACLLRSGKLTNIGRFSAEVPNEMVVLLNGDQRPLVLTKRDVDIFQRAKAAIFAAVKVLLSKASMKPGEIQRIFVGGAFGHFLDVESATAIGLLPDLRGNAIELFGNTALRGCEELLMSDNSAEVMEALRGSAKLVNLAQCSEFEDFFLEGLYLRRWTDCNEGRR